ncbi:MAG: MFS transporter [Acidobacteriota bacterium]|nr:MFS transporter [Acidobacteriota bacterium]MDE3190482.1 MFS transporter [Acidobacteriota bacterium]
MAPDPRRWQALALVCAAFFMTVLDVSIVNVALPSIGRNLHFSQTGLQWVITAYAITFGGFLLLGGRLGDILGRKKMFLAGVVVFSAASLVCGLASSTGMLIAARAVQGFGAAVVSPSTLSIVTTTFEEGAERNKALGIWGAMGGSGAAAGVLFGGILTKYAGWEWIFFVNVPVGALVLLLAPRVVRESRAPDQHGFDLAGAGSVTAGLALLVYAISKAPVDGWGDSVTIGLLAGAAALIAFFLVWETRTAHPLMPLSVFRIRTLAGANIVGVLLGASVFANFFLLTLYVQNVLHFSALKTGITFLATAGTTVVVAALSQWLTTQVGPRIVMSIGLALNTGGLLWYAQIPVHGSYVHDLLGGYLLVGFGLALAFIPVSIAALAGVGARDAGLASGLLNTSQQVGGAIGVAIATSVAVSRANHLLHTGSSLAAALTSGYALAFWVVAGISAAGVVAALTLVRDEQVAAVGTVAA